MTPEDIARREEEERQKLLKAERQKKERRCPACDNKTYPADCVKVSDVFFHKVKLNHPENQKRSQSHPLSPDSYTWNTRDS